jgi:two-component system OmpR family response regulator
MAGGEENRGRLTGLRHHGITVEAAATGQGGLDSALGGGFSMILMDVDLPDISGFDVVRALRKRGETVPIMMLTALNAEEDIVEGLESGADGYVTKPFSIRELAARMEAMKRRSEIDRDSDLSFSDIRINEAQRTTTRRGVGLRLTETEFRLLAHFLRNPEEVVTRDELLREVWGIDFDPGTGVVDVHLGNLRKKLRSVGPPLIQTVRGVGFRLRVPS